MASDLLFAQDFFFLLLQSQAICAEIGDQLVGCQTLKLVTGNFAAFHNKAGSGWLLHELPTRAGPNVTPLPSNQGRNIHQ